MLRIIGAGRYFITINLVYILFQFQVMDKNKTGTIDWWEFVNYEAVKVLGRRDKVNNDRYSYQVLSMTLLYVQKLYKVVYIYIYIYIYVYKERDNVFYTTILKQREIC